MYNNFDFNELERATQESLARIYSESLSEQEYQDPKVLNETYQKVRKILECPEMEKCHPYLYSLDMDNFNDEDTDKINKIYDLGVNRGMIQGDEATADEVEDGVEDDAEDCEDGALCGGPNDALTGQEMAPQPVVNKPIYTVMYSAQKDGHGAMGEFYSMAPTIEGAKEDCINQMTANGYNDISIMAIDQTFQGVEDDYTADYSSNPLDGVSPNASEPIEEDDSEEYLKQETGDDSKEEETTEEEKTTEEPKEETSEEPAEDTEEGSSESEEPAEEESTEETEETEGDEEGEDKPQETEKKSEDGDSGADGDESTEDNEGDEDDAEKSTEEDSSEEESEEDEKKNLTADEKFAMKTLYTKTFKDVLKKIGNEKSVDEMTLQERTEFYTQLAEKWDKNDPADFMDDKDQEKLNKIIVKKDTK